jgi:hypothetical protein
MARRAGPLLIGGVRRAFAVVEATSAVRGLTFAARRIGASGTGDGAIRGDIYSEVPTEHLLVDVYAGLKDVEGDGSGHVPWTRRRLSVLVSLS